MPTVWFNGALVPAERATVSVLDRGVIWGYGLFETLRAYSRRLWAFEAHHERLADGARLLDIPLRPAAELRAAMEAVLEAEDLSDAGVRVTITRGAGPPDPHAEPTEPPNTCVTAWPLRDYTELYERGAALVTLPGGGRPLATVKATSYAVSVVGRLEAARAGADDALFVGAAGEVLEGTGSNIMAVSGSSVLTPPVDAGVLAGVTRGVVLEVVGTLELRPEERALTVDDLLGADEVFMTSSLREVYPVRSIDGRTTARGPFASRLREAFRRRVSDELGLG